MKIINQPINTPRGGGYTTKAFTLIELLVVIAIIGILAAVVIASLNSARAKARDARRFSAVRQVQTALEMYYADNGGYPVVNNTTGCGENVWETGLAPLVSGGYLPLIPSYPQKTATACFHYASNSHTSSTFNCNGVTRAAYQYSIFFVTEGSHPFGIPSGGLDPNTFNACIVGPVK